MDPQTFKNLIIEKKIRFIPHHNCGICGCCIGYYFEINPITNDVRATFDSSCDCGWSPARPVSLEQAAAWYENLSDQEKQLIM